MTLEFDYNLVKLGLISVSNSTKWKPNDSDQQIVQTQKRNRHYKKSYSIHILHRILGSGSKETT